MNIVAIAPPPRDLSANLRKMADDVDAGRITDVLCVYTSADSYSFLYAASLHSCLVMASMLWHNCVDRMRA